MMDSGVLFVMMPLTETKMLPELLAEPLDYHHLMPKNIMLNQEKEQHGSIKYHVKEMKITSLNAQ